MQRVLCRLLVWMRFYIVLVFALLSAVACREPTGSLSDAQPSEADGNAVYPAPRTDLVPGAGSETTFELATWNIRNFPKSESTVRIVADLIASLDIDMIVMQEVEDTAAFDELVERLRGYEGLVSSHVYNGGTYQKIGYIYRSSLVSVSGAFLLFGQDGYEFPRPPLKLDVVVNGESTLAFTSIGLHLKAGGGFEDRDRRQAAVLILEEYLRTTVNGSGNDRIVVVGDFNDTLGQGSEVFAPITVASDRYTMRTTGNDQAGDVSFVPSSVILDHVVTTSAFDDAFGMGTTIIPRLDMQMSGYGSDVSDHLPVIMRVPL